MKCSKCGKKMTYQGRIHELLFFSCKGYYRHYTCACGHERKVMAKSWYKRKNAKKTHSGTLNPARMLEEDWQDRLREVRLEEENPIEAMALDKIAVDLNRDEIKRFIYNPSRRAGKATYMKFQKQIDDAFGIPKRLYKGKQL